MHDQLELAGWDVRIADAYKAKGLARLACKTDQIDSWVLAELGRLQLVPEVWLADPAVRAERERARFRLHLVKHRTALKNRIHATLIAFGVPNPTSDLFGAGGRDLLARVSPAGAMAPDDPGEPQVDRLPGGGDQRDRARAAPSRADHRYIPLLLTCPGVGWILAFTIASELGDITRFPTPTKFVGYTGLCPKVDQSGERDWRGPLRKNGPTYLRWALVEAAHTALCQPCYRTSARSPLARHGRKRGRKIAAIEVGRKLAEAIWYMLSRNQPFAPAGAVQTLTA